MHEVVQDYYGKQLQSTEDLKTSACCDISNMPSWLKPLLANIHDEVLSRYYGCGLVCPALLEGCRILDLGCGSGRDVYALAQLVGRTGHVVGVDMTDEQLAIAKQHQNYHVDKFGYDNVTFLKGYIEKLDELNLDPNSFDIIVSNCVINLSPDKAAVMASVQRLLKPGGEFYFSDVYADRRIPQHLVNDPVLYGECLSGALYWKDFERLARHADFLDPRLVEDRPLEITDSLLAAKIGDIQFFSATYRLFKIATLEDACEDHGQAVIYYGTIDQLPHHFNLDKHHTIETGRVFPVCGNTFRMLKESRFAKHFDFIGDDSRHYGIFAGCGDILPFGHQADIVSGPFVNSGSCC
ncbi:methyltransferase domain-containing protein [Psychrobacter sp. DD43]|uniref:methyltransferase domain-containing protein n=1 Tax=Psychrobacter sp. DD43 TaxID=2774128 RepID=UPI0019198488|nr:methyltransferase domain-containing protein [Psychrobacter sp. DD43]|tara:strand:- start:1596 stop:2651 length:1056 start_codon:yes stop_codon:yes gene_type:complete